jgi:hypothetical protein
MRERMHFHYHYIKSKHDEKRMKTIVENAHKTVLEALEQS